MSPTTEPVKELSVSAYTVPTEVPEADGTLSWDATTLVLVQARSGGGVTGLGWTYAPPGCAVLIHDLLAEHVRGRDALDVTASHRAMVQAVRNAGRPGAVAMAISAVDTALWDLKARLLDLPLHKLFGALRSEVPIYGSGGFTTFDDDRLARQLTGWTGQGIGQVKIKIGESRGSRVDRDLARVRLARRVVGPDVGLFVDANGAYTAKQAIRLGAQLTEQGVSWFEEPVSSDDLSGLRRVREAVSCDVTAGEYGYDLTYFERMCAAGAVDCLQVDVTRCGGYTEWQRAAAVAAAHHLDVSGHCAPHLHAPAAAATPNLRHLEWFADHVRIESMLFDHADPGSGGRLRLADGPGHGLEFRARDAEPYRVAG